MSNERVRTFVNDPEMGERIELKNYAETTFIPRTYRLRLDLSADIEIVTLDWSRVFEHIEVFMAELEDKHPGVFELHGHALRLKGEE